MGALLDLLMKNLPKILGFIQNQGTNELAKPGPEVPASTISLEPITKAELLKGRDKEYASEYTQEVSDNLDKLLVILNKIQDAYGKKFVINSGWRPAAINAATPGAAPHSKHQVGLAADIGCTDGLLWNWVLNNLKLMQDLDVFMEDRRYTPTWVHFGLGKPNSGRRIFVPSANRAPAPENWNGEYDKQYDVK